MSEQKPQQPATPYPIVEACANCRFSRKWPGDAESVACVRFPPQLVQVQGIGGITLKPMTPKLPAVGWCGEWSGT